MNTQITELQLNHTIAQQHSISIQLSPNVSGDPLNILKYPFSPHSLPQTFLTFQNLTPFSSPQPTNSQALQPPSHPQTCQQIPDSGKNKIISLMSKVCGTSGLIMIFFSAKKQQQHIIYGYFSQQSQGQQNIQNVKPTI
ncbi:Hypothetical_protein [Hexamita inflata]|uniref:Hypothetical_protein n=1 Tax=Hexamita inflata TaxID=28002 RepID=A0AA86RB27_9EUKA|nr:Hypothetical protein HINF_LOCUS62361 [Hexamita inflata]